MTWAMKQPGIIARLLLLSINSLPFYRLSNNQKETAAASILILSSIALSAHKLGACFFHASVAFSDRKEIAYPICRNMFMRMKNKEFAVCTDGKISLFILVKHKEPVC